MPFPFVERERIRARPALIVSLPVGPDGLLLWSLMITAAKRGRWPGDIELGPDHLSYGLPVPCVIRTAKVIAFEARAAERRLGRISDDLLGEVQARLRAHLSLP